MLARPTGTAIAGGLARAKGQGDVYRTECRFNSRSSAPFKKICTCFCTIKSATLRKVRTVLSVESISYALYALSTRPFSSSPARLTRTEAAASSACGLSPATRERRRAASAYGDIRRREQVTAKLHADTKARRDFEALNAELAEKRRAQAEARLQALSPEQQQSLRARVRAELLRSHWLDESSPVFQRVLRRGLIAEIIREMGETG
jgi:hypothetical protein